MASMDLFEEWRMDDAHAENSRQQEQLQNQNEQLQDLDEKAPMFTLQRLDWSVERCAPPPPPTKGGLKRLPKEINKVDVANHKFVIGTTDGSILRWNKNSHVGDCEEIDLSKKPEDNIKHLFVGPSGNHTIVVLKNGDSYYIHTRSSKPKKLSKLQGTIEAVGFDRAVISENNTKSFLVGTSTGRIYEMSFEVTGKDTSGKERLCQLVHQLEETSGGISSIYLESSSGEEDAQQGVGDDLSVLEGVQQLQLGTSTSGSIAAPRPSTSASGPVGVARLLRVLFTTSSPARLYHLQGRGLLSSLFQDAKASDTLSSVDLPGSGLQRPELLFSQHDTPAEKGQGQPQCFALLTKLGMYHGALTSGNVSLSNAGQPCGDVLKDAALTAFEHKQHRQHLVPLSILMTDFHFLLLYQDALVVQSKITGEVQQEENLLLLLTSSGEDTGEAVALLRDQGDGVLWLVTTTSLFQIDVIREDRSAWKMHLEQAERKQEARLFDTAHMFCKTEDHHRKVHRAQADYFLASSQIEKAATQFALAGVPFDEVLLLLLSLGVSSGSSTGGGAAYGDAGTGAGEGEDFTFSEPTMQALRVYLREKLSVMPADAKSQRTMIATWLCEIFLHSIAAASHSQQHQIYATKSTIELEFKEFLRKNRGSLDNATTISLLLSRGVEMRPLLLFYSQIIGDYERVVSHYTSEGMIGEAISVLKNAPIEKVEELIYKKAPVLMSSCPEMTVELFLSKDYLIPTRLLPALFRYSELLDKQYHAARLSSRAAAASSATSSSRGVSHDLLASSTTAAASEYEDGLDQDSDGNRVNFAIFYLESYLTNMIERERSGEGFSYVEASVQHALVWLLAKYDDDQETGLLKLIIPLVNSDSLYGDAEAEGHSDTCLLDRDSIDISYVLRECKRGGRTRSCVYLYVLMNCMEKAVAAALEIDLQLAKDIASRYLVHQHHQEESGGGEKDDMMMLNGVTGATAVGKRLWLQIIEFVVRTRGKGGISMVLEMLHDSNGLLRIEDILQHLPDFTEIDLFKDEICHTLEDYASRIELLKGEMDELSSSAEAIDKELVGVTTRGFAMRNYQRCEVCSEALQGGQGPQSQPMLDQFYLFPCGHGYHEACLLNRASEYLESNADALLVVSLKEQIRAVSSRAKDADKRSMVQLEHLQAELDGLVAADCPLCGDHMIRSTSRSLLACGLAASSSASGGLEDEAKSWEL